jgi:uncharacterized sporulation protein YeaH/YhbH (DUF444 family)
MIGKQGQALRLASRCRRSSCRSSASARTKGGVGQGEGEGAKAIAVQGEGRARPANRKASTVLEVDVELEELAKILGEELELPNIEPKGKKVDQVAGGASPASAGSARESLRHFKRTFREALKRQIASGTYDPDDPVIVPIKEDKRYRPHGRPRRAAGQRRWSST